MATYYQFVPLDSESATHTRKSDGLRGLLVEVPDYAHGVENLDSANPDDYDIILTEEEIVVDPPVVQDLTPQSITNWRAKAVIEIAGLTSQVEAALAAMQGPEGIIARAAWNGNADFDRQGATVVSLAAAIGLTSAQIDALFIQAAAISV